MIDLDPKTHFAQFYLKVASYFLSWGKNKCDTGNEAVMKMHKKSKFVYQK